MMIMWTPDSLPHFLKTRNTFSRILPYRMKQKKYAVTTNNVCSILPWLGKQTLDKRHSTQLTISRKGKEIYLSVSLDISNVHGYFLHLWACDHSIAHSNCVNFYQAALPAVIKSESMSPTHKENKCPCTLRLCVRFVVFCGFNRSLVHHNSSIWCVQHFT